MIKILITGANGQLGRALSIVQRDKKNVQLIKTDISADIERSIIPMDITNLEEVRSILNKYKPDIIINCAAFTAVDLCETEQEKAYQINAIGPKNLAIVANELDAVFVHISTDYVFDGEGNTPLTEDSKTNPQTIYGRTKLSGEELVQSNCSKYFIIRTAWLYGDGKNFVKTMLRLAETNHEVRVVNDQYGTPTSALELARMIFALIKTKEYGIYHGTNEGSTSWYEFAVEIFKQANKSVKVVPISSSEFNAPAKRPNYSVLSNERLKQVSDFCFMDWKDALKEYLND